jgi:hypothetical protein
MSLRFAVLAVSFGALLGRAADCSSSNGAAGQPDAAAAADGDIVGCLTDPRDDTYSAGMTKPGQSGSFQFVLVSAEPGPPAILTNTWTVRLLSSGGAPVTGATFSWGPKSVWMPDHGHGSTATPQVQDNGDGTYTVTPLYFYMAGLWQITLTAQSGGTTDTAVFSFCVQG